MLDRSKIRAFYLSKDSLGAMDTPTTSVYVSLTTIRRRIQDVHITIQSLLNQTVPPTHVFLYISEDTFLLDHGISRSVLETTAVWKLAQAQPDKLTIHYVPNKGPARKLAHILCDDRVKPDDYIVTVDDDNEYNPDCLERLVTASRQNPEAIISNVGCKVNLTYTYSVYYNSNSCRKPYLDQRNMAIGFGGVLYKPRFFGQSSTLLSVLDTLSIDELKVDDIVFKLLTHRQGVPVRVLNYYPVVMKPQPTVSLYTIFNMDKKKDGTLANNDICFIRLCKRWGVNPWDFVTFFPAPFTNADTDTEARQRMEVAWGPILTEPFHLMRVPAFVIPDHPAKSAILTESTLLTKLTKGSTLGMYMILSDKGIPTTTDADVMHRRIVEILRFLAAHYGDWDLFVGGPTDIGEPLRIISREAPCVVECGSVCGTDLCVYSNTSKSVTTDTVDPQRRHGGRIWVSYPPLCRPTPVPAEWENRVTAMLRTESN